MSLFKPFLYWYFFKDLKRYPAHYRSGKFILSSINCWPLSNSLQALQRTKGDNGPLLLIPGFQKKEKHEAGAGTSYLPA